MLYAIFFLLSLETVSSYLVVLIFDDFLHLLFTVYTILRLTIDVFILLHPPPLRAHTHPLKS